MKIYSSHLQLVGVIKGHGAEDDVRRDMQHQVKERTRAGHEASSEDIGKAGPSSQTGEQGCSL